MEICRQVIISMRSARMKHSWSEEAYSPEETTVEYMLKDMMQRINNREADKEDIGLLPDEVQMNYSIEDNVLVVNFNSKYQEMSGARELLVRAGVVKTFLQVPGITAVRFTVENEDLLDSRGEPVGEMTEDTFAEFSGSEPDAYCSNTFTLYFTDKEGQHLVKEQRTVRYKRSIPKEWIILQQLMKGPLEKGHYPTIPENTEILNVTLADNICYVAFRPCIFFLCTGYFREYPHLFGGEFPSGCPGCR